MLVRWTSAEPTQRMIDRWGRLNRMFDDTFGLPAGEAHARAWVPAVDVAEDEKSYTLALELPGVRPSDVSIQVDGKRLLIQGEKKQQLEEKTDRVHRFERSFGSFQRVFVLPDTVDAERIDASSNDGVLTITLPKTERAKAREIPIRAS
jgi:HSP20 family protein